MNHVFWFLAEGFQWLTLLVSLKSVPIRVVRFSESSLERWRRAIVSRQNVVVLEFWSPCLPQFSHELSHCRWSVLISWFTSGSSCIATMSWSSCPDPSWVCSTLRLLLSSNERVWIASVSNRWTQRETLMYDCERGWDETQEHLEPWGACDTTSKCDEDHALSMLTCCATCACRCSCHCTCCWCGLSHACPQCSCCCSGCKYTIFRSQFSAVGDVLFHTPRRWQWTALAVAELITVILHQIHCETHSTWKWTIHWFSQVSPFDQCQVHRRGDVSDEGCHQESCHCHHEWGRALPPILMVGFILGFLEAMQGWQRFLEVRTMPCRHRVRTHKIRTCPPIATTHVEFFFCGNVGVVFVRQLVHLANHFFSATHFDHDLSDAQEFFLLALLFELIHDEVLVISFFPNLWPCGRPCRTHLIHILFCFVSSRKWWPHVQQTMPTSQHDRHTLNCALGSTSSSSHSSVFPTALFLWFFAERVGLWTLLKNTLKYLSMRVVLDFLNQTLNVGAMWLVHCRMWHSWDVEVNVLHGWTCCPCWTTQFHDVLREHIVLSLCVHLNCYTQLVALIHCECAQHGCFHTDCERMSWFIWSTEFFVKIFLIDLMKMFHLFQQTHLACPQVALVDHRFGFGIGWVGWENVACWTSPRDCRTTSPSGCWSTVEWNFPSGPIVIVSSMRSFFGGGRGDKHGLSYKTFPIFNLSTFGIQQTESVPWRTIAFDRVRWNVNPFRIARSISTQNTASCFFHALCKYCARRGTRSQYVQDLHALCLLDL